MEVSPCFVLDASGGFLEAHDGLFVFGSQLQHLFVALLRAQRDAEERIGLRKNVVVTGSVPQQIDTLAEAFLLFGPPFLEVVNVGRGVERRGHAALVILPAGPVVHLRRLGGRRIVIALHVVGGD